MSEQIDQFFRPDGTLISIPVKLPKKPAVLRQIASELSPDTKYPEKQLNEITGPRIRAISHQKDLSIERCRYSYQAEDYLTKVSDAFIKSLFCTIATSTLPFVTPARKSPSLFCQSDLQNFTLKL